LNRGFLEKIYKTPENVWWLTLPILHLLIQAFFVDENDKFFNFENLLIIF